MGSLCGFAAFRAESLWLSVNVVSLFSGYAARGEASLFLIGERKAGGFPHGWRQSRESLVPEIDPGWAALKFYNIGASLLDQFLPGLIAADAVDFRRLLDSQSCVRSN